MTSQLRNSQDFSCWLFRLLNQSGNRRDRLLARGMVALLAEMVPGAKVVGIDINQPPEAITEILNKHGLGNRARFHGGVSQDDKHRVRSILDEEFGDEPLDLIVDDASHLYEESKASFEASFSYLRPGGQYIIEDWGWAHWNHKKWQEHPNRFSGRTPLTQLMFVLTMVLATRPGIVARLDMPNGAMAVVTRGGELRHKEPLDLNAAYLPSGRHFVGLQGIRRGWWRAWGQRG